jgi:uncharacterized protein (TIGR03437 family)
VRLITKLKSYFASVPASCALLVAGCLSTLYAQNIVSLSPTTVFLAANTNAGPVQATVTVTSSPGAVGINVAPSTASWLTVTQGPANTPTTVTVTGNPAGLTPAVYSSLVTINTPSGTVPLQVVMTVNNPSSLVPGPNGLVFNFIQGSTTPPAGQNVSVTSSSPSGFTVSGTSKWILFSTNGQTAPGAPGSVTVNVDPAAVGGPGVYVGGFSINPASGLPPVIVPVVFYYQTSPPLTAAPSSLTFSYQPFATNNVLQKTLNLSSGGVPVTFGASASVATPGASWLAVAPTQGTAPAALTVSTVQPGGLPPGDYKGTVTITAPGASNSPVTVPVTLTISTLALLDLNITNLNFTYQVGGVLPPDQFITPTSTTPNLGYTLAVSTNNTGNWLNAASLGATPSPVDVSVNPVGLAAGTYNGTITFNAPSGGNGALVVNVTLNVVNNPTLVTTPATAPGVILNYETGGTTPASQIVSVGSSGAPLNFSLGIAQNSTSNGVSWLQVGTPSANTTPATFTVGANITGMAPGQYTSTLIVTTPNGANQVTIPVTLNITAAGTSLLFTKPQSLTFNLFTGGTGDTQTVAVNTTGEPIIYTATPNVSTPTGGTWLLVGPPTLAASATNMSNFTVGLNASTLAAGTYRGSVVVAPNNGTPNAVIPVTLNVSNGNLTASPPNLTFTQAAAGIAPPPQTLNLTSTGTAPLGFTIFSTGGNWFSVSPPNGNTPSALNVTVNGSNLQPGTYSGQINIVSPGAGNSPLAIPITLTVTSGQTLSLSTGSAGNSLSFTAGVGGSAPPAQTVTLSASSGSLSYVTNINITSPQGGNWLSVSPASGSATTAPSTVSISVNPQGLAAGTYNGSVTVTSPNASNSPLSIPVTLVVTAQVTPTPSTVLNGGSLGSGAVAPGEIIVIRGTNMGPAGPAVQGAPGPDNMQPTLVSDTQVTFDNIPAPLLSVSATEITAAVPYEVDGKTQTKVIVTYKGTASSALTLNVAASAPGIFASTTPGVPATQGKILNADGSPNSPDNPAAIGTPIVIFATGEGQTNPAGVTGLIIAADENAVKRPVLEVSVTIGGVPADIQDAGSVPGSISGSLQINAVVPDGAPSGSTVPIVVTVGGNSSTGGTTLAVQ